MSEQAPGMIARLIKALRRRIDPEGDTARADIRRIAEAFPEFAEQTRKQIRAQRKALVAVEREIASQRRGAVRMNAGLEWIRQAVARQRRVNAELLRMAGLDEKTAEHEQRLRARMERLVRSNLPIIVGPWGGEVGFELLYWIPFLQALRQAYPIDPERLIVISRGGVRPWYGHVGGEYVETFDLTTPEAFREATEAVKKQRNPRGFEKAIVKATMRARGLRRVHLIHPSLMYELFWSYWADRATLSHIDEFASFRRLPPAAASLPPGLPGDYVAVRFYFSDCFPDTPSNREFIARTLDALTARTHVVLLNTPFAVDDHSDFVASRSDRVHTIAEHMSPPTNLATQTAVIANARAFVGTYGGYAYLAPFYGVNSIAFYSRTTFKRQHLDLAHRVFERLGTARLLPVDLRAVDAVELAFGSAALSATASGAGGGARS